MGPLHLGLEVKDRENWRFKGRDELDVRVSSACFEDRGDHMIGLWVACRSWVASGWQPVRIWGPQSYTCKELNWACNLSELGSKFFPTASTGECSPPWNLDFGLVRTGPNVPACWPTELWASNWVLTAKFMVICEAVIENEFNNVADASGFIYLQISFLLWFPLPSPTL